MVPVGGARPIPNFAASQPAGEFMGPGRSVNRQFCGGTRRGAAWHCPRSAGLWPVYISWWPHPLALIHLDCEYGHAKPTASRRSGRRTVWGRVVMPPSPPRQPQAAPAAAATKKGGRLASPAV